MSSCGVPLAAPYGDTAMAKKRYVVMTVERSSCKTMQKVLVAVLAGFTQMADEMIRSINCDHHFNVTVPDRVILGPFPV